MAWEKQGEHTYSHMTQDSLYTSVSGDVSNV